MAEFDDVVVLSPRVRERLTVAVRRRFPTKSFGYLLSPEEKGSPTDFVIFEGNRRNDGSWRQVFHSFGRYFVEHDDAGFVAPVEESWTVQKQIWARGLVEVAAFHSHQRHPANFSGVDYHLHVERFPDLWHLIISLRNPRIPQIRAFSTAGEGVRELTIVDSPIRETGGVAAERVTAWPS